MNKILFLCCALWFSSGSWALSSVGLVSEPSNAPAKIPVIVTSIVPLYSLVAAVTQGVTEPSLLVPENSSPHFYALKPSNREALDQADLVVWIGPGFEAFLVKTVATLSKKTTIVAVSELNTVKLLTIRQGGIWGKSDESHGHDHGYGDKDMHLWLDPMNAQAIIQAVADQMVRLDPAREMLYRQNAKNAVEKLSGLDKNLETKVAPARHKPYMVFHDAYQYFEHRYHLTSAGSITLDPEHQISAARLSTLRQKLKNGEVVCVFTEPQFPPKVVENLVEGTSVRVGQLDPLGKIRAHNLDDYVNVMNNLVDSLVDCLD